MPAATVLRVGGGLEFGAAPREAVNGARMYSSERTLRANLEALLDTAPVGLVVFRRRLPADQIYPKQSRDEFMRGSTARRRFGGKNPLRKRVSALRRKLGDSAGKPVRIHSECGVGYGMAGPGEAHARDAGPEGSPDPGGKPVESLAGTAGSWSDGNTHLPF